MTPTRDELATRYLDQLPYPPYPVQEEALLAWFTSDRGVLVCAPTGTGKTLIAQAALYEALHSGTVAYYTTPLIALTDQKFQEMQAAAERWGFSKDDIGLVTGNRKVNPGAKVLVVVAEILLNRLLHPEGFDFHNVSAVVMDEFHSFADPERGIVWELSLSLLPKHVRLLLLSATVGNAVEFLNWLDRYHGRKLELAEGHERKIPLTYHWMPDEYLNDMLVEIAKGDEAARKTPALVFAFNRDECWSIAEQLKGLDLMTPAQKSALNIEVDKLEWPHGVGPKLKQMLRRGVGVHHAGLLPKYRRVIERLFEQKLLSIALCTETLASGINLPARSVVLTSLVKGPFGKEKLIDPSTAHQIFGRAGRPQFDTEGHVFVGPHEDDVRIAKWKKQFEQIPETTKDPAMLKMKKALLKKKPSRNTTKKYWTEVDFDKLKAAPPARLYSKGPLPWRLLAYLLKVSPEVEKIRAVVRKRLLDQPRIEAGMKQLDRMLLVLHERGFVVLEPEPPKDEPGAPVLSPSPSKGEGRGGGDGERSSFSIDGTPPTLTLPLKGGGDKILSPSPSKGEGGVGVTGGASSWTVPIPPTLTLPLKGGGDKKGETQTLSAPVVENRYQATRAVPTAAMDKLLVFRACHPIYGAFLVDLLGQANPDERVQLLESVLEIPRPLLKFVRVPGDIPPGPLALETLDPELVARGLILAKLPKVEGEEEEEEEFEERPPTLAEKAKMLFDAKHPDLADVNVQSVWAAGEVLRYGGNFNQYVTSNDLTKQEGIIFRHLLRFILLIEEFIQLTPPGCDPVQWQADLRDLADKLTEACRKVDPTSTEETIAKAHAADVVEGEEHAKPAKAEEVVEPAFGAGLTE